MSTVEPPQDGDMSKAPAFQFYAADFLIGTLEMSLTEIGLYIKLLSLSWDKGPLPLETSRLARLAGTSEEQFVELWEAVQPKWKRTKAGYINERLEAQRAERKAFADAQAEKAKRRWRGKSGNAGAYATAYAEAMPEPGTRHAVRQCSSVFDLQSSEDQEQERERRLTPLPSPQSLVDAWNSGTTAPIPKCKELTPKRRAHAIARLRDATIDIWRDVIARIEASAFCRGQNDRGWVATFDWLLQPETRVKVLEGKYDNRVPTLVPDGRRATDKTTRALEAAQIAIARHRASGGN